MYNPIFFPLHHAQEKFDDTKGLIRYLRWRRDHKMVHKTLIITLGNLVCSFVKRKFKKNLRALIDPAIVLSMSLLSYMCDNIWNFFVEANICKLFNWFCIYIFIYIYINILPLKIKLSRGEGQMSSTGVTPQYVCACFKA